jgi:molybdate transport system regulatory protein
MAAPLPFKLKLQIMCGDEIAMGPGKAALLEAIAAHGSISGAGRALGMSYRRAWLLVDAMNRCWESPLVATVQGNAKAGAQLTALGQAILTQYRAAEGAAEAATATSLTGITHHLRPAPIPPRRETRPNDN